MDLLQRLILNLLLFNTMLSLLKSMHTIKLREHNPREKPQSICAREYIHSTSSERILIIITFLLF
jgi:hypothetical protein